MGGWRATLEEWAVSSSNLGVHGQHDDHNTNKRMHQTPAWRNSRETSNGHRWRVHPVNPAASLLSKVSSSMRGSTSIRAHTNNPGETHQRPWSLVQCRPQKLGAGGTTQAGYHQWPQANQQHCSARGAEALVLPVWTAALSHVTYLNLRGHPFSCQSPGEIGECPSQEVAWITKMPQ